MGMLSCRRLHFLLLWTLYFTAFSVHGQMRRNIVQQRSSPRQMMDQIRADARNNNIERAKQLLLNLDVSGLHSTDLDYVAFLSRQYRYFALEEHALQFLVEKNPGNLEVLYRYTCVLLRLNKTEQAAVAVDAMRRVAPGDLLTRYSAVLLHLANTCTLETRHVFSELDLTGRIQLLDLVVAGGEDLLHITGIDGFRSLVLNVLTGFWLDEAADGIPPAALAVRRCITEEPYAQILSRIKNIAMYLRYAQEAMDADAWQKASNDLQEAYAAGAVHPSLQGFQLEVFAHKGLADLALKGVQSLHLLYPENPSLLASEERIKDIAGVLDLNSNPQVNQ